MPKLIPIVAEMPKAKTVVQGWIIVRQPAWRVITSGIEQPKTATISPPSILTISDLTIKGLVL